MPKQELLGTDESDTDHTPQVDDLDFSESELTAELLKHEKNMQSHLS
jgi:hypothetical protein